MLRHESPTHQREIALKEESLGLDHRQVLRIKPAFVVDGADGNLFHILRRGGEGARANKTTKQKFRVTVGSWVGEGGGRGVLL